MSVADSILPKDIAVSDLSELQHASHHHLLRGDFAELFEGGSEIFDGFRSEHVGIGMIVAFFEALVASAKHYTGINFLPRRFKIAMIFPELVEL